MYRASDEIIIDIDFHKESVRLGEGNARTHHLRSTRLAGWHWCIKKKEEERTRLHRQARDVIRFIAASREIRVKIMERGDNRGTNRRVLSRYRGKTAGLSFDLIAFRGNGERKADTSGPR